MGMLFLLRMCYGNKVLLISFWKCVKVIFNMKGSSISYMSDVCLVLHLSDMLVYWKVVDASDPYSSHSYS